MSNSMASSPFAYTIDPSHSAARFWVKHLMVSKVDGAFNNVSGIVKVDAGNPENVLVDVTVDTASLSTGQEFRDAHLKGADFFDVAHFPVMRFRSTKVRKVAENEYEVTGDLTMRDVTKEVRLVTVLSDDVVSPTGTKIGVCATGKIDREAFGKPWNQALEAGGVLLGKDVHLQIEAELNRSQD